MSRRPLSRVLLSAPADLLLSPVGDFIAPARLSLGSGLFLDPHHLPVPGQQL